MSCVCACYPHFIRKAMSRYLLRSPTKAEKTDSDSADLVIVRENKIKLGSII